ncbi:MAG: hypothetical protein ABEH40_00710 [Haloferacaceae archaeon]
MGDGHDDGRDDGCGPPSAADGEGPTGGADADRGADAETADAEPADAAEDRPFAAELDRARDLLAAPDLSAFAVGAVRGGRTVETTFSYRPDAVAADREGIQALTLLAAHVRVVADEAGVDPLTAATDAAALADRVEELDPGTGERSGSGGSGGSEGTGDPDDPDGAG